MFQIETFRVDDDAIGGNDTGILSTISSQGIRLAARLTRTTGPSSAERSTNEMLYCTRKISYLARVFIIFRISWHSLISPIYTSISILFRFEPDSYSYLENHSTSKNRLHCTARRWAYMRTKLPHMTIDSSNYVVRLGLEFDLILSLPREPDKEIEELAIFYDILHI